MEYSSGLLKPDCLKRGIEGEVLDVLKKVGLRIIATKRIKLSLDQIKIVYECCLYEDFFNELVDFLMSGEVLFYIVSGENAINKLNDIVGNCIPEKAENYTIRNIYGKSIKENVIHSTETIETFWKEVELFFSEKELRCLDIT